MEGNPKRLRWLLVGAVVLIALGLFGFFSLERSNWLPQFIAKGAVIGTRSHSGQVQQHPFRKKIGPNSYQAPSGSGVTWTEYELSLGYDSVVSAAKTELTSSEGWEEFFMGPIDRLQKSSYTAGEMDHVFLNENRAITVFRSKNGNPTRVRVWRRSPSFMERF